MSGSKTPITGLRTVWRRASFGKREFVLLVLLYAFYSMSRLLASNEEGPALARAHWIHRFESGTGLGVERRFVDVAVTHPWIGLVSSYWYSTAHYVVTPIVLIWLYRKGQRVYAPARAALVIATFLGLLLYLGLPTAPPRLVSGYPDVLALHANAGWWGSDASAPRGVGGFTNQLAAFPSLHAGWSFWIALVVQKYARGRWIRVAGWMHAILTAVVVIDTANHWILDVLGGWLLVCIGWAVVSVARRNGRGGDRFGHLSAVPRRSVEGHGSVVVRRAAGVECGPVARDDLARSGSGAEKRCP